MTLRIKRALYIQRIIVSKLLSWMYNCRKTPLWNSLINCILQRWQAAKRERDKNTAGRSKGVVRIFGRGSAIWSEATDSATCLASEVARSAANQATAVVRGRFPLLCSGIWREAPGGRIGVQSPPENFQDVMLILDTESTCKRHFNKKSNNHWGCKNEQQADFEVKLQNIITDT